MANGIKKRISKEYTLVWENPNPTENFDAQTIEFDISKYLWIMVEFLSEKTNGHRKFVMVPVGGSISSESQTPDKPRRCANVYVMTFNSSFYQEQTTNNPNIMSRVLLSSVSGVGFTHGTYKSLATTNANVHNDAMCRPMRIWAR